MIPEINAVRVAFTPRVQGNWASAPSLFRCLPHACRGIGDRFDDVDFVKLEKKEQKWDIG